DQDGVDRRSAESALAVVADVAAICAAWSAAPAKRLQSGGVGVREVRKLAKQIGRPEDATARLVELAYAAGLVDRDDEAVAPTAAYDAWLAMSAPGRWVELALAWVSMPVHLSVAGAEDPDGKAIAPLLDRPIDLEAVVQRDQVMRLLAGPGPGRSVDPKGVRDAACWLRPALWEHTDLARPDELVRWFVSESEMLGFASTGGLAGFARRLLAGDASGAEEALSALAPPLVDRVILQADMTATVAGEPEPDLRAELDLLADVESTGHATVWRFSEASLRRGFDAGGTAGDISGFLTKHAAVGVPQPLAYLVEDLGRRHGQLRVGTAGCYIRCDDTSLLAEIQRSKKATRLHLRLIAPTVAVSDRAPADVTETLRAAGYLPAEEGPDGTLRVTRPPARRVGRPGPGEARPSDHERALRMLGLGDDDSDDPDLDDPDLDGPDLDDPDLDAEYLSELVGAPPEVIRAVLRPGPEGPRLPTSDEELGVLVARLRAAPVFPAAATGPASAAQGTGREPSSFTRLFEDDPTDERPNHIAKDPRSVAALLDEAFTAGWPIRMCYVNSTGREREFFAEILDLGRGTVRVRYLDEHGGGDLAVWRVRWARVATKAEEEYLG
ncbi:MAG: helicase-associated domain-containing protein, partial [Acidimicrobiales bacterium]